MAELGIELSALSMPDKHSTIKLYNQPSKIFFSIKKKYRRLRLEDYKYEGSLSYNEILSPPKKTKKKERKKPRGTKREL